MQDSRYPNGHKPKPEKPSVRSAGIFQRPLYMMLAMGKLALVLGLTFGGIALIAEMVMPADSPSRPANVLARFFGDTQAGIADRIGAIDSKWEVITHDEIARIDRETAEFNESVSLRSQATMQKIDQVDTQLGPRQLNNWIGEISCGIESWGVGDLSRACETGKAHRADVMAEREKLIGDVLILRTDEELAASMGVSNAFRKKFGLTDE